MFTRTQFVLFLVILCGTPPYAVAYDFRQAAERNGGTVDSLDLDRFDLFSIARSALDEMASSCDAISPMATDSIEAPWTWQLLPSELLWQSYWADPHEPRLSTVIFGDQQEGIFWDATLGGRVGLLRYGGTTTDQPVGWQWDLEGAVVTRLDLLHAEDVESMDYRFGTAITAREGAWAMKLGYFHISSHVGDEYIARHPLFQRRNYVTESWVGAISHWPSQTTRLYAEIANAFHVSGGARRYQFQTGIQWNAASKQGNCMVPFAAVHLNFREAVGYDVSTTLQAGCLVNGTDSRHSFRWGLQYGDGPSSQYQFIARHERYLGAGLWYDF